MGRVSKAPRLQLELHQGVLFMLNIADSIWSFSQGWSSSVHRF